MSPLEFQALKSEMALRPLLAHPRSSAIDVAIRMLGRSYFRGRGYGQEIDSHYMVMRLDNAPLVGFEKWVGQRTTHRLVQASTCHMPLGPGVVAVNQQCPRMQADYARMVLNMLGTERIVNRSKSVVTPSTWWVGGYPHVEKVTYLMAVPPSSMNNGKEMRAPEHSGCVAVCEVLNGHMCHASTLMPCAPFSKQDA